MQLTRFAALALGAVGMLLAAAPSHAQVVVNTTNTFYSEAGGGLSNRSLTPSLNIRGTIRDRVTLRAGWEADVVSGASVAVVDAPGPEMDVITSATKWDDFRNNATAGIAVQSDYATLEASYSYGAESDYRSHSFALSARAELFERNTTLEVGYGRGFDQVCNLAQPRAQEAVDRVRLASSDGCFSDDETRVTQDVDLQTFRGAWTQAWAPIFATQLTVSAQIINGFQGNPYRAVWLGRSAAQENHPTNRARFSGNLEMRLWLAPLSGALQISGRVYRDTWDILSGTAELAYEQTILSGLRFRARGRYYTQGGAAFFSDDYARFPRGQYFTGDRELSPMSSILVGGRLEYDVAPGDDGRVGIFGSFGIVAKFDWVKFDFREYRYGGREVPNDSAIIATLGLEAGW